MFQLDSFHAACREKLQIELTHLPRCTGNIRSWDGSDIDLTKLNTQAAHIKGTVPFDAVCLSSICWQGGLWDCDSTSHLITYMSVCCTEISGTVAQQEGLVTSDLTLLRALQLARPSGRTTPTRTSSTS